jgi:hypothetical protein
LQQRSWVPLEFGIDHDLDRVAQQGRQAESTGLMRVRAVIPMRGWPAKPLPAPTSSTSKVTGRVLPIRVSVPSTLPLRGSV